MNTDAPAARGYSDTQAAKCAAAYGRLIDAGETPTVHALRDQARVALSAAQAWLAANHAAPGTDVPDVPVDDLAGILAPLWGRAWTLATEATEAAAAALRAELDAVTERAEAAEAQVTELTAALEGARKAAAGAEDLRADLAAAQARTDAATERAERAEARADEQMKMLGDLIRRESEG